MDVSARCSRVLEVGVELLFVARSSVPCVSGLLFFVPVNLLFVVFGCVVVVGELAVPSRGI